MPDDESINGTEDRPPTRRTLRQVRKSLVHGGLRRNERRAIATSIVHTSELYPKRELT